MKIARLMGPLVVLAAVLLQVGCSCNTSSVTDVLILSYDPDSIDFGVVPIGQSRIISVTLRHAGTSGTIKLTGWDFRDTSADVTVSAAPDPTELGPGEETTISVKFAPTTSAGEVGELIIEHNVATQNYATSIPISAIAPVADVIAQPNPVQFGQVKSCGAADAGEPGYKDIDVQVVNAGSDTARILGVRLDAQGSDDFSKLATVPAELPVDLGPGDKLGVVVRYEPRGGGSDQTNLFVDGEQKGEAKQWVFPVRGSELGPNVEYAPVAVDFGWVMVDDTKDIPLTLTNKGNDNLILRANGMNTSLGSDAEIKIVDGPTEDVSLAPDESRIFTVRWTAKTVSEIPEAPIGGLTIESNDCESPTVIQVFGRVDAPNLFVTPSPVDFGFGAQNVPVQRMVTLDNSTGHGKVTITALSIKSDAAGEFAIVGDPTFPPTTNAGPGEVAGESSIGLTLTFTNKGADTGSASATLVVETNQKGKESIEVPLTALRTGSPVCRIQMVPNAVAFGVQAIGSTTEKSVKLINTGTGYCSILNINLQDCEVGFGGLFPTCIAPFTGKTSTIYKLLTAPPAGTQMAPGQVWDLKVSYTPPKDAPLFGALNEYQGVLGIRYQDDISKATTVIPAGTGTPPNLTYKANVTGQSGTAKISILPADVEYGLTTIGCYSKTYKICVYNSGNAPLQLQDVKLDGCTPEFHLKNVPPLPKNVPAGSPQCFETNYSPLDPGEDKCRVLVQSSDPSNPKLTVPLMGAGTYDTKQCDNFTQVSGQEVDILFVIDDSGSMCEHQDTLIKNYSNFISHAAVWKNDFHIGVITVNVVKEEVMGKLNQGKIKPTYITPGTGATALFSSYANVGCNGGSDSQEAGLEATQVALTSPLVTDTGVPCSSDAACKNDPNICPDPTKCPFLCMDGFCGGWNRGFLRDDAQLEIIILSDEEDQSPASLPFYIDFLKNIKGFYNAAMMHVNAIIWDDQKCQGQSSQGTGHRYEEIVNETGGQLGLICTGDYGPVMNNIGAVAFTPKVQFFLSRLADPGTVKVKVNGKECIGGPNSWKYDAPSNAIIFKKVEENGTCMPNTGDKIDVCYDVLCLTS